MSTSTRPSLGGCARLSLTWDFGALLVWVGATGWALPWGVGPAGRWVCALGKYLDPAGNRDLYGPLNQEYGGTKIFGDRFRGLALQGVTSDLATCGPVQDVVEQGMLN